MNPYGQNTVPPKPPLFDWRARREYFKQYPLSDKQNLAIGCGTLIGILLLCGICIAVVNASTQSSALTQQKPTVTRVVPTPTIAPSPTPVLPTPTPVQQPVQQQPPVQQPAITGVNGNPWGYDFNPGSYIYSPNADFCEYFTCVSTFWKDTNGYVAECGSGSYTHSGGISGACSRNGGVKAILYQH